MPPPSTQQQPQFKWHNTLPAHFSESQSSRSLATPGRRAEKRQIPSPDSTSLKAWNEGGELHPNVDSSGTIPSPTKRHRTVGRASGACLTTPTKGGSGHNASASFSSAESGMQTPPPSSSSMSKRRGRPPKGIPVFESPRVAVISPASSPSKGSRYIKAANPNVLESSKLLGSPFRSVSKDVADDIYEDADTSIDWPSFDDDGFPSSITGSDIFLHSDMGYADLSDPMAFSFNSPGDLDTDSLPSIDPNLIFSSRPTSDASSLFGGYADTDILSSSSAANDQPYQHQYDYSRRERALELQRTQKRKEKTTRKRLGSGNYKDVRSMTEDNLTMRQGFSENTLVPNSSFRAASLDEAISRQGSVARGRENTTPPPSVKHLQPKTEVQLLISPSGRAKTEKKLIYDDSETEVDEAITSGNSVDESMESDSSLDEAMPRGLGPGGKPYSVVRKVKNSGDFVSKGPKLGLFSTTPFQSSNSIPDWTVLDERSPTRGRVAAKPVEKSTRRALGVTQTPRRYTGRSLDECILSSPKLPTPLRSTPGPSRSRMVGCSSYHGSLRMDSRLQPQAILDISDESEAETVVDENVDPDPEPAGPGLREGEQEGNALQALRHAVAKRRGAIPDMTVIRSPARSRIGSSIKQHYRGSTEQPGVIPPSIAKNLFVFPPKETSSALLPPAPQRKILRRRKMIPDGGYSHPMEKSSSFSTISDPDFHASESTEEEGSLESDENIRCICGLDRDGGTLMVQCDSCNSWLHLKCTGLNRKSLPETYNCKFCNRESHRITKSRGLVRIGEGSSSGDTAPLSHAHVPGSPIKRRMC